jgi:hypothetical protein
VCAFDLRNGAWTVLSALKKDFHVEIEKTGARGHISAFFRKNAVSGWLLGRGSQRIRFRLGRPRAGAHGWGRGALILTETIRLPHLPTLKKEKSNEQPASFSRLFRLDAPANPRKQVFHSAQPACGLYCTSIGDSERKMSAITNYRYDGSMMMKLFVLPQICCGISGGCHA